MKFKNSIFKALAVSILGLSNICFTVCAYAEATPIPVKQIQRFTAAISQIKNYYVENVKDDKLFDEAIRGMLAGLDPHSSYLDEQDLKELRDATSGEFSGLGIEVMPEAGALKVITPIDDTPAHKAGVKAGDIIVRIDNVPVNSLTLREAVVKMRGKPGSQVTLTVIRKGAAQPINIKITRNVIKVQSVKSKLLAKGYGYIRISSFQSNTETELLRTIKTLARSNNTRLSGLILDLRNNPGGLLDSAVDVSNLFLDSRKLAYNHLIVYTKGRFPASQFQAKATADDILQGVPMVILINGGSASGAEIVAGALQDHKRAVVLGTRSFGKGSVQTVLPLDEKSALKLTTALYYTPAGRSIQAKGIRPDVKVDELAMPTTVQSKFSSLYLKEADLRGHLNNVEADDETNTEAATQETEQDKVPSSLPSLKTDYQLHEAFNLLKGMVATKHFG